MFRVVVILCLDKSGIACSVLSCNNNVAFSSCNCLIWESDLFILSSCFEEDDSFADSLERTWCSHFATTSIISFLQLVCRFSNFLKASHIASCNLSFGSFVAIGLGTRDGTLVPAELITGVWSALVRSSELGIKSVFSVSINCFSTVSAMQMLLLK